MIKYSLKDKSYAFSIDFIKYFCQLKLDILIDTLFLMQKV